MTSEINMIAHTDESQAFPLVREDGYMRKSLKIP